MQSGCKQRAAEALLKIHRAKPPIFYSVKPAGEDGNVIRAVCVSDTHNRRPVLPDGDVLIHAGDLTADGSFDEIKEELSWLSSQPHRYKILIAGNSDYMLDEAYWKDHPELRYFDTRKKHDIVWGNVIYLENDTVTLNFDFDSPSGDDDVAPKVVGDNEDNATKPLRKRSQRSLTIFGSPWTPKHSEHDSAFQYEPHKGEQIWRRNFAKSPNRQKPDIIVMHGPPRFHLDVCNEYVKSPVHGGCPFLGDEIARLRPRLAVFGHIHRARGMEEAVMDRVQNFYERFRSERAGWTALLWMLVWWLLGG